MNTNTYPTKYIDLNGIYNFGTGLMSSIFSYIYACIDALDANDLNISATSLGAATNLVVSNDNLQLKSGNELLSQIPCSSLNIGSTTVDYSMSDVLADNEITSIFANADSYDRDNDTTV